MREIPVEVATFLKSRSMIGANKPSYQILVGDENFSGNALYSFKHLSTGAGGIGFRFSDGALFVTDVDDLKVYIYNHLNGALIDNWGIVDGGDGCEIDGDNEDILWVSCYLNIDKYKISTKNRIARYSTSFDSNGIAAPPGDYLWTGKYDSPYALNKINKSNGAVVKQYNIPFRPSGVAWDGNLIWVSGYSTQIIGFDIVTESIVTSFYGPIPNMPAITFDGQNLWSILNDDTTKDTIIKFARGGNGVSDVRSINISRNKNMAGTLNLTIDNRGGKYSPDNVYYQNLCFPNAEIKVMQGYGLEKVNTFNGLIDRIEMSTFPQELKLSIRDKLKLALDQTISGVGTHTLTYSNQTVEAIFTDLCSKAGLLTGTIELTGLIITEKTFSWETYADCFQWLSDLVGFEFGADEEGLIYFRKDTVPAIPTVAYTFREGEDIISLGYTIDDNDLYSKVVVYGKDENDNVLFAQKEYVSKDYYNVLPQKFMKIDVSEASTVEQLQAIADRAEMLMRSRVRIVSFAAIAVPWLQIGDVVDVIESSTTISEKYRITDLSTSMDNGGYTMQITCYHHSA